MKNFLSFLSIKKIKENLIKSSKRFPLVIIIIILIFFVFMIGNNLKNYSESFYENLEKINLSLITTLFLSLGFYIFSETEKYSFSKTYLLQGVSIILGILFYLFYGNNFNYESIIFFIITTLGITSFLFFAAFIKELFKKEKNSQEIYFNYLKEISGVFMVSIIVGFVSFFLGLISITSVIYLFDLRNLIEEGKWITNWLIISCSLFAPLYGLGKVPKKEEIKKEQHVNMFSTFLIKYIILPFAIIFFIILYAYSTKVLINFGDWPKGQVAWMVISFSVFAYLTYLGSYSLEKSENNIKIFRKALPFIVIPQLFMLFYSIYVRISYYGLTINRYLVVVFGIILLTISLYLIFSKRKFLAFLPFILTIFSVIISIGPWSIYSLPQKNQLNLLKQKLKEANILQENGEITPLKNYTDIDEKLGKDIYSKIKYICDHNECSEIKKLFVKEYEILKIKDKKEWIENQTKYLEKIKKRKYNGPNKWVIVSFISNEIKVKRYYYEYNNKYMAEFYGKSIDNIDISGYDSLYYLKNYNKFNQNKNGVNINFFDNSFILANEKKVFPFDFKQEIIKKIDTKNKKYNGNNSKKENIVLKFEIENKKYKMIISNIEIQRNKLKDNKYNGQYINGVLLIGKK